MRGLAKAPTRLGRFLLFGFTIFLTQYIVGLVVLRSGGSSLLLVAASFPLMVAIAKYWLRAESKRSALAIGAAGAVPTLGAAILGIVYAQRKERWQQQAGPSPEKRGVLPGRDRLTVSLGIIGTSGLAVVALAFAVAFVGPLVWPVSPDHVSLPERWSGPSVGHPFGTDELGRDNLSRAMVWGRIVLAGGSSSAPPMPQGTHEGAAILAFVMVGSISMLFLADRRSVNATSWGTAANAEDAPQLNLEGPLSSRPDTLGRT